MARNASIPQKRRKGGRIEMVAQGWWTGEEKKWNDLCMGQRVEKHRHTIWKKNWWYGDAGFFKFIPPPKTQKKTSRPSAHFTFLALFHSSFSTGLFAIYFLKFDSFSVVIPKYWPFLMLNCNHRSFCQAVFAVLWHFVAGSTFPPYISMSAFLFYDDLI